jgi:hypothetical protein
LIWRLAYRPADDLAGRLDTAGRYVIIILYIIVIVIIVTAVVFFFTTAVVITLYCCPLYNNKCTMGFRKRYLI